MAGFLDFGVLD